MLPSFDTLYIIYFIFFYRIFCITENIRQKNRYKCKM